MSQPQEPQITNQETALRVIIQGINLAQSRGAYNLNEAELLSKCIKMFKRPADEVQQPVPEQVIQDEKKEEEIEVKNIQI